MGNPFTNSATGKYTLYGTAFGFLFPVAATLLEAAHVFGEVTLASALHVQSQSALLWLMDTIPVGMGLCAWFAVTRKSLTPAASIPQPAGRDAPEFSAPGFWNPLGRILDSSFHELYVFGDDLKLIHVNQQALNNVGYSAEELIGLTPLDLLTETSREEFDSWIRPLRQGEKNLVTVVSVHRRKDGSQYPVEARIQMTRDETPAVFTVLLDDLTQRHR
ncbi:MAG: PAS domain S-box protein, partial [Nitrospinaceae bacterium]